MQVLFVHRSYPAQFGHVARRQAREGWSCKYLTTAPVQSADGVELVRYQVRGSATRNTHYCSRTFENATWHAHAIYEALQARPDLRPDLIVGHSGFGTTALLRELVDCPIVNFFEYYYGVPGTDFGFRPEFPPQPLDHLRLPLRNAMPLVDLQTCTAGYCPTKWQRSLMPSEYQHKLTTIYDGIDTNFWRPAHEPGTQARMLGSQRIPDGMQVVTYATRGFESARGFDIFMRVAKRLCDQRKDVLFVCVGSDLVSYGDDLRFTRDRPFREWVLSQDNYDLSRFVFTGPLPQSELLKVFQLSDLHIYLTAPLFLSWSPLEAVACGCTMLCSDTAPVREFIRHGETGLLADFFDVDRFVELANQILDDPAGHRHLGQSAMHELRARQSMDVIIPQLMAYYRCVAGK